MFMLIINPGSTSTKMALFDGDKKIAEDNVRHDPKELREVRTMSPTSMIFG